MKLFMPFVVTLWLSWNLVKYKKRKKSGKSWYSKLSSISGFMQYKTLDNFVNLSKFPIQKLERERGKTSRICARPSQLCHTRKLRLNYSATLKKGNDSILLMRENGILIILILIITYLVFFTQNLISMKSFLRCYY